MARSGCLNYSKRGGGVGHRVGLPLGGRRRERKVARRSILAAGLGRTLTQSLQVTSAQKLQSCESGQRAVGAIF